MKRAPIPLIRKHPLLERWVCTLPNQLVPTGVGPTPGAAYEAWRCCILDLAPTSDFCPGCAAAHGQRHLEGCVVLERAHMPPVRRADCSA